MVFRVQFHTCTVHGAQLWFGKTELDVACTGMRTELSSQETCGTSMKAAVNGESVFMQYVCKLYCITMQQSSVKV